MRRYLMILLLTAYPFLASCSIITGGDGSWEIYAGFRATQHSKAPAKITLESTMIDKIIDALTDDTISDTERNMLLNAIGWAITLCF